MQEDLPCIGKTVQQSFPPFKESNNFCDFLFTSLAAKSFGMGVYSSNKEFVANSSLQEFAPLRKDAKMKKQNYFPDKVPIHLKPSSNLL